MTEKRKIGRVTAVLLVMLLLLTTAGAYGESLDSVKRKKAAVGDDLDAVMEDLEAQQKEVDGIEKEIKVKETERQHMQAEFDKVRAETEIIQKDYEETKTVVGARIRSMYKSGSIGFLDVVLESASAREFVDNVFFMQKIFKSDKKAIEKLESDRRQLEKKQEEIEIIKKQVEEAEDILKEKRAAAIVKKDEIKERVAEVQAEFDALEREQEAMEAEIARIQAAAMADAAQNGGIANLQPGSGGMIWPTTSRTITSPFGYRTHPTLGIGRMHTGVDIGAPAGAPIYAAKPGIVTYAGGMGSYGNLIIVNHGGGISTRYAHCSGISVSKGQSVSQGQVIGSVGSTGRSTGPHLHFEVRVGDRAVQPLGYI